MWWKPNSATPSSNSPTSKPRPSPVWGRRGRSSPPSWGSSGRSANLPKWPNPSATRCTSRPTACCPWPTSSNSSCKAPPISPAPPRPPPATPLPLAQVRERVRSLYVAEKSAALAQQEGPAKLSAWKAAPATATGLAAATEIARGQGQNLPRPVIDAALRTPADALPAWTGVDLGAAGYAVVKINRVLARQAPDAQRAQQEQQQYAQWLARAEVLAYYELLKQRLKVRIQAPRPQVAAPEIAEN